MGNGGNLEWRTDDDLMPVADENVYAYRHGVYALSVFRLANAKVLPWDWRALLKEFDGTLDSIRRAAGARFDFSPARDRSASWTRALTAAGSL